MGALKLSGRLRKRAEGKNFKNFRLKSMATDSIAKRDSNMYFFASTWTTSRQNTTRIHKAYAQLGILPGPCPSCSIFAFVKFQDNDSRTCNNIQEMFAHSSAVIF